MATSVGEIIRDLMGSTSSKAGGIAAARWISNRYNELVSKVRFLNLRQIGELVLVADVNTGTLSATNGSKTITGSSTTFETDIGSGTQTDWYIQISSTWYRIASIASETSLTLESEFAGTTISGASYIAVKRFYSLDASARWLGTFLLTRLSKPLSILSSDKIDRFYPGRTTTSSIPSCVAEIGVDSSGSIRVEIYPTPSKTEIIHYVFWDLPTSLTVASEIPNKIDSYVLKEGALIDFYRKRVEDEINLGNVEAASLYANKESRQRTEWKKIMNDAKRTQRGIDDVSFILDYFSSREGGLTSITTAKDQILSKWSM